ncbi:MAG: GNAT family N-acetyltransferase [Candidatus Thorarchaeota archaeon]
MIEPVMHPFKFATDLDSVRAFLSEVCRINGSLHYLIPTKIENQKYGPCGPDYSQADDETIKIWRSSSTPNSEIIAVSHRGPAGNYHIEIHPKHKEIEKELFAQIESLERKRTDNERSRIYMYTVDVDPKRIAHLTQMGYEDYGLHEYNYEFPSSAAIPQYELPEGIKVRSLMGEEDYPKYIEIVGSVFIHCSEFMTLERMRFMTQAEFFYHDLHLVATTQEDEFVGFCIYRLDPLTKIAEVEGLGIHPDFTGLGLEKALLCEGMRNLRMKQPLLACAVEVNVSEEFNEQLQSAGYVRSAIMNMWGKSLA